MSKLPCLPSVSALTDSIPGTATISLSEDGLVQGCSPACEMLFGYRQVELLGRHVSLLLPRLEGVVLVNRNEIKPNAATGGILPARYFSTVSTAANMACK
jgi:PAS domain-containing protein